MKKHIFLLLIMLSSITSLFGRSQAPEINRIDPPHWWTGMVNDTLQLMVYGKDIAHAEATIAKPYEGVKILRQVSLESADYKFVYLQVSPEAKPGTLKLRFTRNGKSTTVDYPLYARNNRGALGFTAADVLYLIMPDRFAVGDAANKGHENDGLQYPTENDLSDPNARHGGNIAGIRKHLGYLDSLGVTALWVNPVLKNDMPGGSYHGYATTDYYAIDPRLGTNEEWNEFVDASHLRGLKVVMDMIFNHCGSNHVWLHNPPSKDWFNFPDSFQVTNHRLSTLYDPYASRHDKKVAVDGWFVEAMPDLNQRNPELMRYLIQNSIWWIEQSGIDGIRMDTYPYADAEAMAQWNREVLAQYPDFNIVGECWYNHEVPEAFWQKGSKINPMGDPGLPTVMDFALMTRSRDAFTTTTMPWNEGGLNEIYNHLGFDFLLPDPQHILTFVDNHDTDRFLLQPIEKADSLGSWKQAMTFLLTSRGIPQLYYGTELLESGSKKLSDGYVRRMLPESWYEGEGLNEAQRESLGFLTKILNWRNQQSELMEKGNLLHFAPLNGVYVYCRSLPGGESVIVMLNGTDEEATIPSAPFDEILSRGERFDDFISGRPVEIGESITLAPRGIMMLTPLKQ